jgi:hypothetical protein
METQTGKKRLLKSTIFFKSDITGEFVKQAFEK